MDRTNRTLGDRLFALLRARILTFVVAALSIPSVAHAVVFTVDSLSDTPDAAPGDGVCDDGAGACSLRAALAEVVDGDTIDVPLAGTIALAASPLEVPAAVAIEGSGPDLLVIVPAVGERALEVSGSPVSLSGVALEDATGPGPGAALSNAGTLVLSDCAFVRNASENTGGAISNSGSLSISDCAFRDNTARTDGGAIHSTGTLSIDESRFVSNGAGTSGGALYNAFGARMRIGSSAFSGNRGGWGSAIYVSGSASIDTCDVFDNEADYYAAVYVHSGKLVMQDTTIDGNSAGYDAAGLDTLFSEAVVMSSTISGNLSAGRGGGVFAAGGTTTLINTTVSGNVAVGRGGGIWNGGDLNVLNSTIADNFSGANGGGLTNQILGRLRLKDTLVAGNTAPVGPDCSGEPIDSLGHNLIGDATDCPLGALATDQVGSAAAPLDARLLPLAAVGGPTETHALAADSPALDAGHPQPPGSGVACTPVDQRGEPRPAGAACDVGAYERQ